MIKDLVATFPEVFAGAFLLVIGLWVRSIRYHIEKHITREESITWPKIEERFDSITEDFSNYKLESLERHIEVVERIASIEAKMPDGDIKIIKTTLENFVAKQG